VNIREVDQRRHEIRIELERLAVGNRRLFLRRVVAFVERRRRQEILLGARGIAPRRGAVDRRFGRRRLSPVGTPQGEDLRRRRIDPEVELELALPRRDQRVVVPNECLRPRFLAFAADRGKQRILGDTKECDGDPLSFWKIWNYATRPIA
jgi:hypothetical protein